MKNPDIVERVIAGAGGQSALAKACSVTRQAIQHWKKTGRVPVKKTIAVEAASGVPRHDINPDYYPEET